MSEQNGINENDSQMEGTMTDVKNPWNADLNDPYLGLKLASERLSIVRYVFLVQIEDGIASAAQRASLEYADAVLIGWPETGADEWWNSARRNSGTSTSRCVLWNSTSPNSVPWNANRISTA